MIDENNRVIYIKGNKYSDDLLYHYTTVKGLCGILREMSLKLSPFDKRLDDPVDGEMLSKFLFRGKIDNAGLKRELEQYKLVCFTENYTKHDSKVEFWGSEHPVMWYMYADKYKGACVVFDKKRLEKRLQSISEFDGEFKDVVYGDYYDSITVDSEDLNASIAKYKNDIFFKKHADWSFQKETRLLCHNSEWDAQTDKFLDITGCIDHICLGHRFESFQDLFDVIYDTNSKAYGTIFSLSFSMIANELGDLKEGEFCIYERILNKFASYKSLDDNLCSEISKQEKE